jgi:hypothetical protein
MRWARYVARMGAKREACNILARKPEGERSLRRPRRTWEGNIKMSIRGKGRAYRLDSSGLGWGPVAGSCEHGNEHSVSTKCL